MSGFILVKRDGNYRDLGVFTGRLQLVASAYEVMPDIFTPKGEAEISEHIEHAFIFPHPWLAWLWCDRLMADPMWRRGVQFLSWDVRAEDDLHLGEVRPWGSVRPDMAEKRRIFGSLRISGETA